MEEYKKDQVKFKKCYKKLPPDVVFFYRLVTKGELSINLIREKIKHVFRSMSVIDSKTAQLNELKERIDSTWVYQYSFADLQMKNICFCLRVLNMLPTSAFEDEIPKIKKWQNACSSFLVLTRPMKLVYDFSPRQYLSFFDNGLNVEFECNAMIESWWSFELNQRIQNKQKLQAIKACEEAEKTKDEEEDIPLKRTRSMTRSGGNHFLKAYKN